MAAGVLASTVALVAKERESVDFSHGEPCCYLLLILFPAITDIHIAAALCLYLPGIFLCWKMLQKQCRNLWHWDLPLVWKERVSARDLGPWVRGRCLSELGKKCPQQWHPSELEYGCWLERECFLNEYRAIFNPGIQCCSFVLVTLFISGWRRRGEEGRALEHVAPSWHLLSCSHSSQ